MITIINSNVTAMITDIDAAIKFYTEILGLKLLSHYGNHWAEVQGAGITIGLHASDKKINRSDNLSIAFSVTNLQESIEQLAASGVHCTVHEDTKVNLAFFTDPDGNTLYLSQAF